MLQLADESHVENGAAMHPNESPIVETAHEAIERVIGKHLSSVDKNRRVVVPGQNGGHPLVVKNDVRGPTPDGHLARPRLKLRDGGPNRRGRLRRPAPQPVEGNPQAPFGDRFQR